MDRSRAPRIGVHTLVALLAIGTLVSAGGCAQLLATGMYVWDGGNLAPAECDALEDQRVVVVCRPPASQRFPLCRRLARHCQAGEREAGRKRQGDRRRESARGRQLGR